MSKALACVWYLVLGVSHIIRIALDNILENSATLWNYFQFFKEEILSDTEDWYDFVEALDSFVFMRPAPQCSLFFRDSWILAMGAFDPGY